MLRYVANVPQVGWICQTVVIFGVPYDPETLFTPSGIGRAFFWIFALLPWCPLSKGTLDLASATNTDKSPGMHLTETWAHVCCRWHCRSGTWNLMGSREMGLAAIRVLHVAHRQSPKCIR